MILIYKDVDMILNTTDSWQRDQDSTTRRHSRVTLKACSGKPDQDSLIYVTLYLVHRRLCSAFIVSLTLNPTS